MNVSTITLLFKAIQGSFVWLLRRERYMGLYLGVLWDNTLFETLLVEIYVGTAFLGFCS